jgi:hypothetical protein
MGALSQVYRDEQVPVVKEYLEHLATLDQLLCISTQLREDVVKDRHKYAAHKIALLYHAINSSKLSRDVLRKRIEEHFEDVKEATETQDAPRLPDELARWIMVRAASPGRCGHSECVPRTHWRLSARPDFERC